MVIKKEIEINADLQRVWNALSDVEVQKLWMIGLEKVDKIDEINWLMHVKEGRKTRVYKGKNLEVVELNILSISITDEKHFTVFVKYELEQTDKGIMLHYCSSMDLHTTFAKIVLFIIGAVMNNIFVNKHLKILKEVCERKDQ